MLVHALDGRGRDGLHMSVRVLGQDDVHGMGLIESLHHLYAIAQRIREEDCVVDGVSESAAFFDSNGCAGRQHLGA